MISLLTYKVMHLFGVFLTLMSIGALAFFQINGGTGKPARKAFAGMAHGIGLGLAALGGFGMLARLGYMSEFPGWAVAKLLIWLILGAMPVLLRKQPKLSPALWWLTAILAAASGWIGLAKPF